jgi:hypothetical protein
MASHSPYTYRIELKALGRELGAFSLEWQCRGRANRETDGEPQLIASEREPWAASPTDPPSG